MYFIVSKSKAGDKDKDTKKDKDASKQLAVIYNTYSGF